MLALRSSPPSFGVAEGERIVRDVYGLAVSVHPLPGERDCNFRVHTGDSREFVLKILDVASDSESIDCLVRVLAHVGEQDPHLPVPRLYPTLHGLEVGRFVRDETEYATCLVSYLPGTLLAESSPSKSLLLEVGVVLGRLDRALQGFFHRSLNRRLAWDVRRLPELMEFARLIEPTDVRRLVETVDADMRAALPRLRSLRNQAVHGDCHPGNLLVGEDGRSISGILDFGDMIHAPLIFEPAIAMSESLTEAIAPADALADILRGYVRIQPLNTEEVDLLYRVVTARHAVTILLHAWRCRHDASGAEILKGAAGHAARSLDHLLGAERAQLLREWRVAAGTEDLPAKAGTAATLLARRRRFMGAGAELFYEKPLHLVRASGVWMYDLEDRAYLDVYNNVPHVGHAHPAVVSAIQKQSAILATHTRYLHESILDYAEQLTARLPPQLDACIFVNSGSEANDVAWRIAQLITGNRGAMVMQNAYHGITDAVAALTPGVGEPRDPRVVTIAPPPAHLRANDAMTSAEAAATAADVDQAVATLRARGFAPAAFYIDTAITSSGVFDAPPEWARIVESRVRAAGALIVADEVQYGLGRAGSHFWGFQRRGLQPDIVTLGKPVANGYPMGVVAANREVIETFQAKFGFFSTFGGNAVAAAAALAVLEVIDREELMSNACSTGSYLRARLEDIAARHECLGTLRGAGLLFGLEVRGCDAGSAKRRCKSIINRLASEHRVLIGYEGPQADILKLRPPMPFRREHADLLAAAIEAAAAAVDR